MPLKTQVFIEPVGYFPFKVPGSHFIGKAVAGTVEGDIHHIEAVSKGNFWGEGRGITNHWPPSPNPIHYPYFASGRKTVSQSGGGGWVWNSWQRLRKTWEGPSSGECVSAWAKRSAAWANRPCR